MDCGVYVIMVCNVNGWVSVTTVCTRWMCIRYERMLVMVSCNGIVGYGNASLRNGGVCVV